MLLLPLRPSASGKSAQQGAAGDKTDKAQAVVSGASFSQPPTQRLVRLLSPADEQSLKPPPALDPDCRSTRDYLQSLFSLKPASALGDCNNAAAAECDEVLWRGLRVRMGLHTGK
jgi:hypothetical protein